MPHIIIETSENILKNSDPQKLVDAVHQAAVDTGLFDLAKGGAKVRINSYQYFNNNYKQDDFIHVFAHILEGRTDEQKKDMSLRITKAIDTLYPNIPILSTEIVDIHLASYSNKAML